LPTIGLLIYEGAMPPRKKPAKWSRNKIFRATLMWVGPIALSWLNSTSFDKTELKFLAQSATMWALLRKVLPDT
jgi:hypothetical protein